MLTEENRTVLQRFADGLADIGDVAAIIRGRQRFFHDTFIRLGQETPFAKAALAIADANIRRASGAIGKADADAAVRKVLVP